MLIKLLSVLFILIRSKLIYTAQEIKAVRKHQSPHRNFFATTVSGLEGILSRELKECGAKNVEKGKSGVFFEGDSSVALRAVMYSRTALRVMEKIVEARDIINRNRLYDLISSIEWKDIMHPYNTLKCDTTLGESVAPDISHSHFCSLNVKNAIVDQFREQYGVRPTVDLENPDLPLLLYLHRDKATLYKIWSGEASMHKRGYRPSSIHKAMLRETTAAALVLLTNWNPNNQVLCDPST
jgi:23S rRNA G2445 N2-methylase RlmL